MSESKTLTSIWFPISFETTDEKIVCKRVQRLLCAGFRRLRRDISILLCRFSFQPSDLLFSAHAFFLIHPSLPTKLSLFHAHIECPLAPTKYIMNELIVVNEDLTTSLKSYWKVSSIRSMWCFVNVSTAHAAPQ